MPDAPVELVETFAAEVAAQERCIDRGDSDSGNLHARGYVSAARALLNGGEESIEAFARLLSHPSSSVRVMAAAFLLKTRTAQCLEALRVDAVGSGRAALGAQMALDRYSRGILDIA
jgi:hypothetical protein